MQKDGHCSLPFACCIGVTLVYSESDNSDFDLMLVGGGLLQFVQEVVQCWDAFFQPFAFAGLGHNLAGTAGAVERVPRQDLPMVEHTLGESLTTCVGSQVSCETYGGKRMGRCLDNGIQSPGME